MAYELIKDFQYTNSEKQILTLVSGTVLEVESNGFFHFKLAKKEYKIDKDIVLNNPLFFKKIDFQTILIDMLKKERKRTAPKLAELIEKLVQDEVLEGRELVDADTVVVMLKACYLMYKSSGNADYLEPLKELGYSWDDKGIYQ